jgi:lipopolysaccharide biosynthesis glycosyltransferase
MPDSLQHNIQQTIPVVYAADQAYINWTYISAFSLLKNASPNRKYEIIVMIPSKIEEQNKRMLYDLQSKFQNCSVRFIHMDNVVQDTTYGFGALTRPTLYRLGLATLLPEYDKCVYLDSDTVVVSDIAELFDIDLGRSLAAGVRDAGFPDTYHSSTAQKLNIPNLARYINAGVLLLNIGVIRDRNLTPELVAATRFNYPFSDQDIINSILYAHIQQIPLRFNAMSLFIDNPRNRYHTDRFYSSFEIAQAKEQPVVIHFIDRMKPWTGRESFGADQWRRYKQMCNIIV